MNKKLDLKYREYSIIRREEIAPGTNLIRLEGRIDFIPGQFVQVALDHIGEATFAICSDPHEKDYFEICIRGCGNTSDGLNKLLVEDTVKIRGPYGNGWPIKQLWYKDVVLLAGGMGLVPLRPLIFEIIRNRINFDKIYLFAGFKTADHILFEEELRSWQKKFTKVTVAAEQATTKFWGQKGLITETLETTKIDPKKTIALMCGPEMMCPFCNNVLLKKNMKEDQIYISYERRMECGIGVCQHCSVGKYLVCKDGPVFRLDQIKDEVGK